MENNYKLIILSSIGIGINGTTTPHSTAMSRASSSRPSLDAGAPAAPVSCRVGRCGDPDLAMKSITIWRTIMNLSDDDDTEERPPDRPNTTTIHHSTSGRNGMESQLEGH